MSAGQQTNKPLKPVLERLSGIAGSTPASVPASMQFSGIAYDSRSVRPGYAFFCIPGAKADGNLFVNNALGSGAVCIVSEQTAGAVIELGHTTAEKLESVTWVTVSDVRQAMAEFGDYFFDFPTSNIRLLGVTGTNGKTTTTHLVEHIFGRAGKNVGLIGTLGARWEENGKREYHDMHHTTPQATDLQQLLHDMVQRKVSHVAMEVSSHALSLKRVACCNFAVACLTNITQDHLDFHKTMEHYWRSKRVLFEMLNTSKQPNKTAVVNSDDPLASQFLEAVDNSVRKWTYGFCDQADCSVVEATFDFKGTKLKLRTPAGPLDMNLKLNGRFNVYNTMAALLISLAEGIDLPTCKAALEEFGGVSGRFEVVLGDDASTDSPLCIVDYAHTPDGLENVLNAARALVPQNGRLIAVFGCGGDRDSAKRPLMGEIAEKLADQLVVTSDNPRTEDPEQIIGDILRGIKRMKGVHVEQDRSTAIKMAVSEAGENDVVVVAGKGHETYQILKDQTIDFDDRIEVKLALGNRNGALQQS